MPERGDYQTHASRLHAKAKAEYSSWLASLSAAQRANLARLKVLDGPDDSHEVGGHSPLQTSDLADSPLARVESDIALHIDEPAEQLADEFGISLEKARAIHEWHKRESMRALRTHEADLLSVVVGGLLASKNSRITTAGLAFATGMSAAAGLGSQAEFARSIGVSRTIVSKAVKAWQEQLHLHPSSFQKSEEACATYSKVAKNKHWRRAKVTASSLLQRLNHLRNKS